ncbi:MAG: hypothetical protein GC154_05630 [bacterium]|nr:hypothetical protein [bacterium]
MIWPTLIAIAILQQAQPGATLPASATAAVRNPFTPAIDLTQPTEAEPVTAREETPVSATAPEPPKRWFAPSIARDLRSIAIRKNGPKYALFGRTMVSEGDEIEGFTVTKIELDRVWLSQGDEVYAVTLDDRSKSGPASALGAVPASLTNMLGGMQSPAVSQGANQLMQSPMMQQLIQTMLGNQLSIPGLDGLQP